MIGEVWTFKATNPSDNVEKARPVLIIGDDGGNNLKFVDVHYVIISSSATCGEFDVQLNEQEAKNIGLDRPSVIKTTKIYTGSKYKLGNKIGDLSNEKKDEFKQKYTDYQNKLIDKFN